MGGNPSREVWEAAASGNLDRMRTAVARGGSLNEMRHGTTPLSIAARENRFDMVQELLNLNAVDAPGKNHFHALHHAVHMGHGRVAELLMDRGASRWARDAKGRTPYEIGVRKGFTDLIRMIERKMAPFRAVLEMETGSFFKGWSKRYLVVMRPLPFDDTTVDRNSNIQMFLYKSESEAKCRHMAHLADCKIQVLEPVAAVADIRAVTDEELVVFRLQTAAEYGSEEYKFRLPALEYRKFVFTLSNEFVTRRSHGMVSEDSAPSRPYHTHVVHRDHNYVMPGVAVAAEAVSAVDASSAASIARAIPVAVGSDDSHALGAYASTYVAEAPDASMYRPAGAGGAAPAPLPRTVVAAKPVGQQPAPLVVGGIDADLLDSVSDYYVCPLTLELMTDPVVAADGRSYERQAIADWLLERKSSPITNEVMTDTSLRPNWTLRAQISEWVEAMVEQSSRRRAMAAIAEAQLAEQRRNEAIARAREEEAARRRAAAAASEGKRGEESRKTAESDKMTRAAITVQAVARAAAARAQLRRRKEERSFRRIDSLSDTDDDEKQADSDDSGKEGEDVPPVEAPDMPDVPSGRPLVLQDPPTHSLASRDSATDRKEEEAAAVEAEFW